MKRKLHIALLAACLFTGGALPHAGNIAAAAYTATVYASSLNVRSEPAKNAAVTGSLKQGARVTVTDEAFGWLKVSGGGVSGWVAGYYLQQTGGSGGGTPAVVQSSATASAAVRTATVTASSLRIRSGPGTTYEVKGALKERDTITVLKTESGWARIRTAAGETGWVSGQYISGGSAATAVKNTASRNGGIRGKMIVVDPGHGGSDPGMLGTSFDTMEKDLTLQTSLYLRDYLAAKGAQVRLTRSNDQKPSLARRVQIGREAGADAFVSVHYNSSPKNVSGTLTFFYSEDDDLRLARAIENRLAQGIGLKSNGLSFGNYHILRENTLPAVLVELGFLSNRSDESIVRKAAYQKRAAQAIAEGLADYFSR
ncbi:N-acetylmuramoyl-L-alanine amidase [Paenibacillus tengchongensis]|uniref:N-acetylmuramoyl-L-alanine amidase n=1 Tax=Paenibacillus tengchongensis TaxID=2608684 RepID=UPI00124F1F22|nr:N-acetylmuramoyl-L-alanine amidase [Paenibacillus tengchongensis]